MMFKEILENARSVTLIGSRTAPERFTKTGIKIGRKLSDLGLIGYSGGADGMDNSFMFDYSPDRRRIILPENGFNGLWHNGNDIIDSGTLDVSRAAVEAMKVAGNFDTQPDSTKRKYSRNIFQVLGLDLNSPTDFVLFWAPEKEFAVKGGTGIAYRTARLHNIPTFNLWNPRVMDEVCETLGIITNPPTLDFLW